jgi:cytochrome c5
MRYRRFLPVKIYMLAMFLILGLLVSCSTPHTAATQIESSGGDQETRVEHASVQVDAQEVTIDVKATNPTQEMSINDGQTILENTCAQCHLAQSLLETKKSPAEWEAVLQQMALMGVRLSETEKIVLIEYLATTEEP